MHIRHQPAIAIQLVFQQLPLALRLDYGIISASILTRNVPARAIGWYKRKPHHPNELESRSKRL